MIKEPRDSFLFRLWFLIITLLIATNLILVSFNLSNTEAIGIRPAATYGKIADKSQLVSLKNFTKSAVASAISVADVPAKIASAVSRPGSIASIIRPAATDKTPTPVINEDTDPDINNTNGGHVARSNPKPQWPIHGAITTEFGVPEMPYEFVHTGLDISDGKRPGITPIKPFLPGVIIATVNSGGLGNHVIISHGGGLTSVYGHLYSISVHPGDRVTESTILGYEGSTGVSTGTHLHFEVRLYGQPENPKKFISGYPS